MSEPCDQQGEGYRACADKEGRKENEMQKRKTEIVTARMTPKVKQQLQQQAQDANLTLTDYLCLRGLGRRSSAWRTRMRL